MVVPDRRADSSVEEVVQRGDTLLVRDAYGVARGVDAEEPNAIGHETLEQCAVIRADVDGERVRPERPHLDEQLREALEVLR